MCGIYGVIGAGILRQDLNMLGTLSFLNMQRGMHSTGVLRVFHGTHRAPEITKDTVPSMVFFNKKENETILTDASPVAVMCHNRHATVGDAKDIKGAHPFETERYIGFHNGTLREDKYTKDSPFLTDSEALWADITERGMHEVLPKLYADSAFALAYYDKSEQKVGFVRNTKRPLAFATHITRSVVYYSSDMLDLQYALDKHQIDASTLDFGSWQDIRTDPRRLNFSPKDKDGRCALWNITKLVPEPETPPAKPVEDIESKWESYYPSGTYSSSMSTPWKGVPCKVCGEPLSWAGAGQSKVKDPKYVRRLGSVCFTCKDHLEFECGIDLDDEDADAFVGATHLFMKHNSKKDLVLIN